MLNNRPCYLYKIHKTIQRREKSNNYTDLLEEAHELRLGNILDKIIILVLESLKGLMSFLNRDEKKNARYGTTRFYLFLSVHGIYSEITVL